MKITQIRNATLIVEYAGKRFLVDPMLAEKGAYPGFEGTANSQAMPKATVVASHMEAVNHCVLSRKELRDFVKEKNMEHHLLVPEDGETSSL